MVNEQLGQLYLDLQLEGVAARLTLEEGITSSSSSGEETSATSAKVLFLIVINLNFPVNKLKETT